MGEPLPRSPLAPAVDATLEPVGGVRLSVARTGIKYKGRDDLLMCVFDEGTSVAGVLTRTRAPSAPVDWCRAHLAGGAARALLVNAGNANAFTGRAGMRAARASAKAVASVLGCPIEEIFLASTGVIGEPLPLDPIVSSLASMAGRAAPHAWAPAAAAIMTTDTFPKAVTATARIGGKQVRINGIVKGSGMIAPDMATMLGFIFTDANIAPRALQGILGDAVERSFNAITVDGDTSTSDTVLAFATGASGHGRVRSAGDDRLRGFRRVLEKVCRELAQLVVRDGEGARKFISIDVRGAETDLAARRIGFSIANSPLVKTAIAGEDANWGRIVMAVGKSGEAADRDRLAIWIGNVKVASRGAVDKKYEERHVVAHMRGQDIDIRVDVGVGNGRAQVWTCDLTHGYISINADYRS